MGKRRYRLVRRVETREEREMRELAALGDEADRGTPEQDAALGRGCLSFVRVMVLFFAVMFGSILVTWVLNN